MTVASNYALRLPVSLKKELEALAKADGTSLNQFLVMAAAEKLAVLRTEAFFAERIARADVESARGLLMTPRGELPRPDDRIEDSER
ncbi:hypothetical protein [Sphingomonas sp.]|jgi:uncharacterized protein (DUF1778 family)|uniref:hypothetical protein n=1 Tax=Sphingomonas sp. TaxID=28214 RepID=UPI002ED9C679